LLSLPYAEKTNLDFDPGSGLNPGVFTNGFGDVTATARYTLFTDHSLASTLSIGVLGGVKLPTGRTHITDHAGNPVDRHALPGTGSFDFPLGVTAAYAWNGDYEITADAVVNLTTTGNWNGDPYRYGNTLNASLKFFYKVWPRDPADHHVFLYTGPVGQLEGQDRGARADTGYQPSTMNGSSGGSVLYWTLGIYSMLSPNVLVNAGYSRAIYHDMNFDPQFDADPAETYKILFSLTVLL
jgi:hypothetical protein